jgi:hypothetical protein
MNGANFAARGTLCGMNRLLGKVGKLAHDGLKSMTGIGQFGTMGNTVKQFCANFGFQILYLLAKRWLTNADALGGTGEIAFCGNSQKITDMTKFHVLVSLKHIKNGSNIYWTDGMVGATIWTK